MLQKSHPSPVSGLHFCELLPLSVRQKERTLRLYVVMDNNSDEVNSGDNDNNEKTEKNNDNNGNNDNKNDNNDNKINNKSDKNVQTIMKTNNNININHSELDINKDVNQPEGGVVVFDTSVLITPPPTPSITTSSTSLSPSFSLMTHRR